MKRIITLLLVLASMLFSDLHAQEQEDPFGWTEPILIPSSIYLLSSTGPHEDSLNAHLNVFFSTLVDNSIEHLRKDSSEITVGGNKIMSMEVADLNLDGTDDIIGAWESPDEGIIISIQNPNYELKIPVEGNLIPGDGEQSRIILEIGNFDKDSREEFVIAFIDEDSTINIKLFDANGSLEPELKASINDEDISGSYKHNKLRFAITSGDFDNDSDDEIALISYDADYASEFEKGVFVKVYDVVDNTIIPKVKGTVILESDIGDASFSGYQIVLAGSTVPGYSMQNDKIAVAITFLRNGSPNDPDTYLQLVKTNGALTELIFDDNERISDHYNDNYVPPLTVLSGDIDGNDTAEVVLARSGAFDIYKTTSDLSLSYQFSRGFNTNGYDNDLSDSYDFIEMSNIDNYDGDEVVVVKNIYSNDWENPFPQYLTISTYGLTDDTLSNFGPKGYADGIDKIPYSWPNRTYALALGVFDNTSVTIQRPRYSHRTEINQPIVILNAPPIHFDVFEGAIFDINKCYSGEDCNFYSKYKKIDIGYVEIETEIYSNWAVSQGQSIQGSKTTSNEVSVAPEGIGGSYGESVTEDFQGHFLNDTGGFLNETSNDVYKESVQVEVTAIEDDQIFATLTDYDIWEYPYFVGDATEQSGAILVVRPTFTESRWFPSKSVSGYAHRPIHQVGNILSYYPYDSILTNPDVYEYIQPVSASPTWTVNASSEIKWSLNNTHFTENQAKEEIYSGVDAGYIFEGEALEAYYRDTYLYTHKTSVEENLDLAIELKGLDRSIGPVEYRVTPYAYWSKKGALVVDYSVEPEVDLEGGKTWWQVMYGEYSDVTMILPWLQDPEKGFAITEEAKRQQTKDIQLKPSYAPIGDTVNVQATIRNFSLMNTPGTVKAKFYLGDPADNGELIYDVDGNNVFETENPVAARSLETINFVWIRPEHSTATRLYIVIDPDDSIEEIHEDNNIGWISIQQTAEEPSAESTVLTDDNGKILNQNYPNPFSDKSTISYTLDKGEDITIRIYNISGVLLKTYNQGFRNPGSHAIEIDGSLFQSGLYIYSIQGSISGIESRTMNIIH